MEQRSSQYLDRKLEWKTNIHRYKRMRMKTNLENVDEESIQESNPLLYLTISLGLQQEESQETKKMPRPKQTNDYNQCLLILNQPIIVDP